MLNHPDYRTAQALLLNAMTALEAQEVPLTECTGRILARDMVSTENIPPFDRSPYDGYALRSADTADASAENPVTLRILQEIPAGTAPAVTVTTGTAVKILTGAPIPPGADAVIPFEHTAFTNDTVTVFSPVSGGSNIVRTGEDIRRGTLLARRGDVIDPGLAGTLASQGITAPAVYRLPRIGILSTGSELVDSATAPLPQSGKIRDSNRYMLQAALQSAGFPCVYLGMAADDPEEISALLTKGLAECDAIVSTGGVSVGDYDRMPEAMERSGVELLFRGVEIKPGMACAYGVFQGKPVCGLSGNPASAFTNFHVLALPALRKLMGCREPLPREITVKLAHGFGKKSPKPRFLRGRLEIQNGSAYIALPQAQGNVVLSSTIGCNVMAVIPAGSGPLDPGTELTAFLL